MKSPTKLIEKSIGSSRSVVSMTMDKLKIQSQRVVSAKQSLLSTDNSQSLSGKYFHDTGISTMNHPKHIDHNLLVSTSAKDNSFIIDSTSIQIGEVE